MKVSKWTVRLAEEVESARTRPFSYGSHDCLQFAARCVHATSGVNYAERFGTYTDPTELLAEYGSVSGLLETLFGPACHASVAAEGDVVLAVLAGQESAGICTGTKFWFAKEPSGIAELPRRLIAGCWKP